MNKTDNTQPSIHLSFAEIGKSRALAGTERLPLVWAYDDQHVPKVWYVRSGSIDVFAVPVVNEQPAGIRQFLCTIDQGGLLLGSRGPESHGPPTGETSQVLIGIGTPDTELVELTRDQLGQLAHDKSYAAELVPLIEQWLRKLLYEVTPERFGVNVRWIVAGQPQPVEINVPYSAQPAAAWVKLQVPGQLFGQLPLPMDIPFPIVSPAWIQLSAPSTIQAYTTSDLLGSEVFWRAMDAFHASVVAQTQATALSTTLSEVARLQRKATNEKELFVQSLRQITSIADTQQRLDPLSIDLDDPLLAACRLIGQVQGMEIQAPPNYRRQFWSDPLSVIARCSGMQVRRVVLADDWWRQDNGPLLAFSATDGAPRALLPVSTQRYRLIDPVGGEIPIVDQRVAQTLHPHAYCFYRGFPVVALGAKAVFRFGLPGTRRDWLATMLLGLMGGLLGMLFPIATGLIFARILPAGERTQLLLAVLVLASSAIAMVLFDIVRNLAVQRVETRMATSVEAAIWDRLLRLPVAFFRNYAAGDLAMRAMGISYIRQALTDAAMTGVISFAFSLVSFALLFYYEAYLATVGLLLFVIVLMVTSYASVRQLKHRRAYYAQRGQTAGIVLQLLTGISRLRVAGAEDRALAYWARFYCQQTRLSYRAQHVANKLAAFSDSVPVIGSLAVFASVAWFATSLNVGSFLAFNAAFAQILFSANMLSTAMSSIIEVIPLYERAYPILSTLPEGRFTNRPPVALSGDIEISHVSFRYSPDGPLVLDDISLHIHPGEFVAFVGPSGAGKSTVLRMLLGFENPTTGSIYFDRQDLAGLDLPSVRRQMGVVLQDSQLSPGDILSNITRSSQYSQAAAWEAAVLTGLDQDIREMPMGMYTVVSDAEATLSGGQRQRLLITRAIVSRPNVLLFDEATSALDNISQAKVSESLEKLKVTRIVVAHRLSTIMHADRICVIDHGKLVQQGTYTQLINRPGAFAELAKRQIL